MSDVSDKDDRLLVQLARKEGEKINWDKVASEMKTSGLSRSTLRQRLKTLKQTYGRDLNAFPRWFFISDSKPEMQANQEPRTELRSDGS